MRQHLGVARCERADGAVSDWLILSDTPLGRGRTGATASLDQGLFALEFQLPLAEPTVLLDYRATGEDARTFSVLYDPRIGIVILHRQDNHQRRHALHGPLPHAAGTARLSLHFDAEGAGVWLIRLELPGTSAVLDASGTGALPMDLNAFDRLCSQSAGSAWHPSVLWFGLSTAKALPPRRAWLGRNSPVMTRRGAVYAESLRAGDEVAVLEHGFVPLRGIGRIEVPSRGSYAPVLLRTPFFGATSDLIVSSDQLVMVGGVAVEYMFNTEEVLLRAAALVNGRAAMLENRRASTLSVTLDFGRPVILLVDGVGMLIPGRGSRLPRRVLADYEAHPLLPLIEPGSLRVSA